MTAAMHDHVPDNDLLEAFLALDTPEGFKAELIEGEIIVTPPPDGDHEGAIGRIVTQVIRRYPGDITVAGNKGLIVPGDRYIPGVTFAEEGAFDGQDSWMLPEGVLMVVEVTSRKPGRDREAKRRGYAAAGIPLYLLVDRGKNEVVLHSDPWRGDYHGVKGVPTGQPLPLPAPFGFDLSTDRLT
ncbi:Uma2 family endonuclease [Kitasatospora sp. NPDC096147]|uniref:Uma2 family endonuclease n=1 Tax=Kitasatospora sp. NPDC096147 TaxID=3364093 RepID=UPI003824D315